MDEPHFFIDEEERKLFERRLIRDLIRGRIITFCASAGLGFLIYYIIYMFTA